MTTPDNEKSVANSPSPEPKVAPSRVKKAPKASSKSASKAARAAGRFLATRNSRLARLHFGPPLLPGEKMPDYFQMLDWVSEAVQPEDVIERTYVKEIVDASLDIERMKHMSNAFVRGRWLDSLTNQLAKRWSREVAEKWVRDTLPKGDQVFARTLAELHIDSDNTLAEIYRNELETIERINNMIAVAEKRRARAIRDVEKYQDRKRRREKLPKTLELRAGGSDADSGS